MSVLRQVNFDLPPDEVLAPGHAGCPGCGVALAMRVALKALGRQTVLVIPSCCWSVIDGRPPHSAAGVPLLHTPEHAGAAAAAGVRAALDLRGEADTNVVFWSGTGGTWDQGVEDLRAAAARNENILYVCHDSEVHVNSGGSAGEQDRKDLFGMMAALNIPYAATASVAFPDDLARKIARARGIAGTKFLHVLTPCPPEWDMPAAFAVRTARLAVMARVFPLVEVEHGTDWRITLDPGRAPLEEYLGEQGRFAAVLADPLAVERIRRAVDERWQQIINRTGRPLCG